MAITPLPTPPSTSDPANFNERADAFLGALPRLVSEINATGLPVQVYEVGTFTPAFRGSTTNPSVTYDIQVGRYIRMGGLCWFALDIRSVSVSGGSGAVLIDLPFPAATGPGSSGSGVSSGGLGFRAGWTAQPDRWFISRGSTTIALYTATASSMVSDLANSSRLVVSGSYPI